MSKIKWGKVNVNRIFNEPRMYKISESYANKVIPISTWYLRAQYHKIKTWLPKSHVSLLINPTLVNMLLIRMSKTIPVFNIK